MRGDALRDDQSDGIRDLLPGRRGLVGLTAKDNRLCVEALVYPCGAGTAWRDLPEGFGAGTKASRRFSC